MRENRVRFIDEPIVVTTSGVAIRMTGFFLLMMGLWFTAIAGSFWIGEPRLDDPEDVRTAAFFRLFVFLSFGILFCLGYRSTPRGRWIIDSDGIDFLSHRGNSISLSWRDVERVDRDLDEFHGSGVSLRIPWAFVGSRIEKQCKPKIREALAPYIDFRTQPSHNLRSPKTWARICVAVIAIVSPWLAGAYINAHLDTAWSQRVALVGAGASLTIFGCLVISTIRKAHRVGTRWLERRA